MPQQSCTSSAMEKIAAAAAYGQHHPHPGQPNPGADWSDAGIAVPAPSNTPFVKRITNLLCPCCGFSSSPKRVDGYQQIPDAPPEVYGPKRPYIAEKPPTLLVPSSDFLGVPSLDISTPNPFTSNPQPTLASPPIGFLTFPDQPQLPQSQVPQPQLCSPPVMSSNDAAQPNGLPGPGYFATQPLLDQCCDPSRSVHVASDPQCMAYQPTLDVQNPSSDGEAEEDLIQLELSGPEATLVESSVGHVHNELCGAYMFASSGRGSKRRPFRCLELREQTAFVRKIGCCIRCRMQRIRCDTNPNDKLGCCLTCERVRNPKIWRQPCLRYKITDMKLYKAGQVLGFEWTRRWNNNISDPIQRWASNEIKIVHISDGYSQAYLQFEVRKFVPQAGDKLCRTWDFRGAKRSVEIPPYALINFEAGKDTYQRYIKTAMPHVLPAMLGGHNELLLRTYQRAMNVRSRQGLLPVFREVLEGTLNLWMAIRLSTRSCFIVGQETLGMSHDILDETNPNHGMIPVPPVLGAQLDVILIHHIQSTLRRNLLDKLQKLIQKNKQRSWFVIYLIAFILLHNTALIIRHDASYARKHGMKRRFAREEKVKEYHKGANIILAYFHYCNKASYPFSEECKDQELRTIADLGEEEIQFVRDTRAYVKHRLREWQGLQDQAAYEDDFFYVSQLYEQKWEPREMA